MYVTVNETPAACSAKTGICITTLCIVYRLIYIFILHCCSHGTSCAGIIAGRKGTDCGVGIAYDAQISG